MPLKVVTAAARSPARAAAAAPAAAPVAATVAVALAAAPAAAAADVAANVAAAVAAAAAVATAECADDDCASHAELCPARHMAHVLAPLAMGQRLRQTSGGPVLLASMYAAAGGGTCSALPCATTERAGVSRHTRNTKKPPNAARLECAV